MSVFEVDAAETPDAKARLSKANYIFVLVFGLFFAFTVWAGVDLLVTLISRVPLNPLGWGLYLFTILLPLLVFALVSALSVARRWWLILLNYSLGLAVIAVYWCSVVAYSVSAGAASLLQL